MSIPARADDERSWARGVSAAEQATALELYEAGNADFAEDRFVQALARYKEALTHWDHPAIRYNIAICLLNLGQLLEAKDNLDRGMAYGASPFGADKYEAGLRVARRLEAQLADLTITSREPGTEVLLDGRRLLAAPGSAHQLMLPGAHQVVATRAGFPSLSSTITLAPGSRTSYVLQPTVKLRKGRLQAALELTLDGADPRAAVSDDLPEDPPPSQRRSRLTSERRFSLEAGAGGGLGWDHWKAPEPAFSIGVNVNHPITHDSDLSGRGFIAAFHTSDGGHLMSYVGASIQHWWREHAWIAVGQGLVFASDSVAGRTSPSRSWTGIGLHLGIGYAVDADSTFPCGFSLEMISSAALSRSGMGNVVTAALFSISIP